MGRIIDERAIEREREREREKPGIYQTNNMSLLVYVIYEEKASS